MRVSFAFELAFVWRVAPNERWEYAGRELCPAGFFSGFSFSHDGGNCLRFAGGFWDVEGRFCVCDDEASTDSVDTTWPFNAS